MEKMDTKNETITEIPVWVNYRETKDNTNTKGLFSSSSQNILRNISIDTLRNNFNNLCHGITQTLVDIKKVGDFKLKEIELQVEISAEGGVSLIGTSKIEGSGSITLRFSGE